MKERKQGKGTWVACRSGFIDWSPLNFSQRNCDELLKGFCLGFSPLLQREMGQGVGYKVIFSETQGGLALKKLSDGMYGVSEDGVLHFFKLTSTLALKVFGVVPSDEEKEIWFYLEQK